MSSRAKRSLVWSHFVDDSIKKIAKCIICNQNIPYSGNTSNLWSHFRVYHRHEEYSQSGSLSESLYNNENNIESVRKNRKHKSEDLQYPQNSKRAKKITEALVYMLAIDTRPFSMIENEGFIKFLHELNPKYKLPDRKLLSTVYLPELYKRKCHEIKKSLDTVENIHLTTDLWTDTHRQMAFLGVSVHYYIGDKLNRNILETTYFPSRHTAINIKTKLMEITEKWNIKPKVKFVVTDNGSNMIAALNLTSWTHLSCFAHTLNLIVQNALKNTTVLSDIIDKCHEIVHIFKSSNVAAELLRNDQLRQRTDNETPLSLKRNVPTRWNTTYPMIERILQLKSNLCSVSNDLTQRDVPLITYKEWNILRNVTTVLKPFFQATEEMSGEKYVTISNVIPLVHCIEENLNDITDITEEVQILQTNLLSEMYKRFGDIEEKATYTIATLLDPRFKKVPFLSSVSIKNTKRMIVAECKDLNESETSMENNNHIETHGNELWRHFENRKKKINKIFNPTSMSCENELKRYLSLTVIENLNCDPFVWWMSEGTVFPQLQKLAKKYLSIPATSVPSERIFSKAGEILSQRRSRLQPKYVNMLTVISMNK